MKKHFFKISSVIVLTSLLLTSCNKTVVDNTVYVDSYIHSIYNKAGVPVYNVVHSAFSYVKLSSVSVSGTLGTTVQLPGGVDAFSFYTPLSNAQDSAQYKTTIPAADTYTYKITYSNGDATTKTDATTTKTLLPAQQLSADKSTSDVVVKWNPVVNADAYKVRIFSQDATATAPVLIYETDFMVPVSTSSTDPLTLPFSLVTLSQYLNTNLSFEVSAFIFAKDKNTYDAVSTATVRKYFGQ